MLNNTPQFGREVGGTLVILLWRNQPVGIQMPLTPVEQNQPVALPIAETSIRSVTVRTRNPFSAEVLRSAATAVAKGANTLSTTGRERFKQVKLPSTQNRKRS